MKKLLIIFLVTHFTGIFLIAQQNPSSFTAEESAIVEDTTPSQESADDFDFDTAFDDFPNSDDGIGSMVVVQPEKKSISVVAVIAALYAMHIKPTVENVRKFFRLRKKQKNV